MSAPRDTPAEISDFFDWSTLADRVEAFGLAAIAHAMREARGTERADIAREAARNLEALDGTPILDMKAVLASDIDKR